MQPSDLNALAARLREWAADIARTNDQLRELIGNEAAERSVERVDRHVADLTAAADALAALAAPPTATAKLTTTPSGNTMFRLGSVTTAPSVAEAREALEQAISAVADAQENYDYNDPEEASADRAAAKADCEIAIDRYASAVRAEAAPPLSQSAGEALESLWDDIQHYASVRELARGSALYVDPNAIENAVDDVDAALDRYAAAVRADVPKEVREAAVAFAALADEMERVGVRDGFQIYGHTVRLADLRAAARHGGAT